MFNKKKRKPDDGMFIAFRTLIIILAAFSLYILGALAVEAIVNRDSWTLDFSSSGVFNFLQYILKFKEVLGATAASIGIYLIIRQLLIMMETNKLSSWIDWRTQLEKLLESELGKNHIVMVNYFSINAKEIHDYLFKSNMVIRDKEHLTQYFNTYIVKGIIKFEKGATEYKKAESDKTLYLNDITSYSYKGYFNKISKFIAPPGIYYNSIEADLKDLYINEIARPKK